VEREVVTERASYAVALGVQFTEKASSIFSGNAKARRFKAMLPINCVTEITDVKLCACTILKMRELTTVSTPRNVYQE